jgi:hypothetical protein
MKYRVVAELLAVRALVLAALAALSSVGLYVSSRGAELRAFKRARANGEWVDPPHCPSLTQSEGERLGSDELDEVSGMAASRLQPDLFWVHNDSGDDARIFAVGRDGSLRAEVVLDGVDARDFEDIALRSGPDGELLYVADTGNNLKRRDTVQLHVLREPRIARVGTAVKLHRTPHTVEISYEDRPRDVEAMFVDARGDVYLVSKAHPLSYAQNDGVYRVTAAEMKQERAVARRVAWVPAGPATAAAISPDGRALAIRNYWVALWWPLGEGESPVEALQKQPCRLSLRERGLQGEALTFLPDGSGFVTLAEGKHPRLFRYTYGPPLTN